LRFKSSSRDGCALPAPLAEKQLLWPPIQFEGNRIYIPKSTCDKIVEFAETLVRVQFQHGIMVDLQRANVSIDAVEAQLEEFNNLDKRVPELLRLLEEDFQRILEGKIAI